MKKYLITPIIIMFLSCSTNSNNTSDPINGGVVIGLDALLHLKDSNGNNLIGSEKYPINGVFADYLIKDKIVKTIPSGAIMLDYSNNIRIINQNNNTDVIVYTNSAETEDFPITYIHWNATETDTIKTQIKRIPNGGGMWIEKLWIFKNNEWVEQLSGEITFVK